ncbi:MAG TPA: hypothetical protein VND15_02100 [Candidatus Acidoferrales bacterium]|nr:hypothetical protein [Candidatus Acidoferrales bacterium]
MIRMVSLFHFGGKKEADTLGDMAESISRNDKKVLQELRNGRIDLLSTMEKMAVEARNGNPKCFDALVKIGKEIESSAQHYLSDKRFAEIKQWNHYKKGYRYLIHEVAKVNYNFAKATIMHPLAATQDFDGKNLIGIMVKWEHDMTTIRAINLRKDITKNKLVL